MKQKSLITDRKSCKTEGKGTELSNKMCMWWGINIMLFDEFML